MKLNSAFFYSLLTLSLSQLTMNTDVWAQNQKDGDTDRWFEIEVILFQQLGDKANLKEKFPKGINASTLPKYKHSFDLLGSYLQPDLTNIKQLMPQCGESKPQQFQFLAELLQNVGQVQVDSQFNLIETELNQTRSQINDQINEQSSTPPITLDLQKEDLAKAIFSTKSLCIITQTEMADILDKEQLDHFNIDSFGVDALPSKLNAMGLHDSEKPYLIADESLLLKDIYQGLRWSKEFQPLLHFGWRQVGITEKDAIPLKLFAGDHIEYQYQKALTTYQAEVEEANAIEKNLLEKLSQNQTSVDNEFKIDQAQKPQVLTQTQLFSRLDALEQSTSNDAIDNEIINNIVNQINKQNLDTLLTQITQSESNLTNDVDINDEIPHGILPVTRKKLPHSLLQPWFLDGFLKIHLDHYLYITADFNLYNQDPIETISDNGISDEVKLINFSQNRRVITGEIHYFDHPYIGMVIQIRRFDPSKPEGERVSQAIR